MKKIKFLLLVLLLGLSACSLNPSKTIEEIPKEFVYVEGGEFEMGNAENENERPVHKVKLNSFYISKYELTQKEYKLIIGRNPSEQYGSNLPVSGIDWINAITYCNKRSEIEGLEPCYKTDENYNTYFDLTADGYRLPTEAEWEYAARGGQKSMGYTYSGSNDIDEVAWYWKNSGNEKLKGDITAEYEEDYSAALQRLEDNNCRIHIGGKKKSNELGLYDMSGNVWEWCWDGYGYKYYALSDLCNPKGESDGKYKIFRGGGWDKGADFCRSSYHFGSIPVTGSDDIGIRLVRRGNLYFKQNHYHFKIDGTSKTVGKISAVSTHNNHDIKYILSGDEIDLFTINDITGDIGLIPNHEIDLNKTQVFELTAEASYKNDKSFTNIMICIARPPEMVFVEGGEFEMGQPDTTVAESKNENNRPVHKVCLNSFLISKYEVTQAEYASVTGVSKSYHLGDSLPIESISWYDAVDYCNMLSEQEGLTPCYDIKSEFNIKCDFKADGYRLPTEAEWEYAARGGQKSRSYKFSGSNDIDEVAWYWKNSGDKRLKGNLNEIYEKKSPAVIELKEGNNCKPHEVGEKKPNELGIHDMSGNAWEVCWDTYDSKYYNKSPICNPKGDISFGLKVFRGGYYFSKIESCSSVSRGADAPIYKFNGIRLVRSGKIHFNHDSYHFIINENDTIVGNIKAASTKNDKIIEYSLFGEGAENFHIDSETGKISINPDNNLYFNKANLYVLIAEAKSNKDKAYSNITIGIIQPPKMILVEEGEFEMGQPDKDIGRWTYDEQPVHNVTLSSFYISKYEVTQLTYESVMGNNPSQYRDSNNPIEGVSWYDAVEFCNKLSILKGLEPCYSINKNQIDPNNKSEDDRKKWLIKCNFKANGYRLPTEAEWEFAAKGGIKSKGYTYSGSSNIDEVAWYTNDRDRDKRNIGMKKPNELGLYDMSGNVEEWCWDWYDSNYYSESTANNPYGPESGSRRIVRGGHWFSYAEYCRSANRGGSFPFRGLASEVGFRIVQTK